MTRNIQDLFDSIQETIDALKVEQVIYQRRLREAETEKAKAQEQVRLARVENELLSLSQFREGD